ncbi:MAG: hypothetical protein GF330_00285 [Candidatus Eisenbacteria bacterium]|nr:hypothetical protein [Candidatus Eisenbacteria bacterium]
MEFQRRVALRTSHGGELSVQVSESRYREYLSDLLAARREACQGIVRELIEQGMRVRTVYLELFQRSLYEVGELWERNQISVATEQLATATTEILMSLVYPTLFSAEHLDRCAVVSCTADEFHQNVPSLERLEEIVGAQHVS